MAVGRRPRITIVAAERTRSTIVATPYSETIGMQSPSVSSDTVARAMLVTLSETARRLAHVETAAVEWRFVDHGLRLVGTVDFDETRQRSIAAWVPGSQASSLCL